MEMHAAIIGDLIRDGNRTLAASVDLMVRAVCLHAVEEERKACSLAALGNEDQDRSVTEWEQGYHKGRVDAAEAVRARARRCAL